jgi:hypothetical protein
MAQTKRKRRSKHRGTAAGTIESRGRTGRKPVFLVAVLLLFKQQPLQAISLACFMVLIYLPMGYYTDLFLYRRRQRKKALEKQRGKSE